MKAPHLLLRQVPRFALWLTVASLGQAQTAIWRGPAATNPNSAADWWTGSYWSTGSAPAGAAAVAVIEDGVLGDTTSPLRSQPGLTAGGTTELGGIRFDSAGGADAARAWPGVIFGAEGSHTVRLAGSGISVPTRAPNAPHVVLNYGTTLEFTNSATISGQPPSSDRTGTGHPVRIVATNGSTVSFRDQSSAGSGAVFIHPNARLEFLGDSSAANALIIAGGSRNRLTPDQLPPPDASQTPAFVAFRGAASLGYALIRTDGRVEFHDTATAGRGFIESGGETWFFGQSSLGSAVIQRSSQIIFMDQATAGTGIIGASLVEFKRQSTAGRAVIGAGTVRFSDQATAGLVERIYSDRLEVLDQADLSTAGSLGARLLDISGARATGGSSARNAAGTSVPAGSVVADNACDVAVRNLMMFGGTIHLGSNNLVVTGTYLDGKISDTGGAYRDQENREFTGGGLIIRGYTRVSHPDNDYSGATQIQRGTLLLAGGALSRTTVDQGALLYGIGVIKGHLINNGTVNTNLFTDQWGRTLRVRGDYHQGVTGNLQMLMLPTARDSLDIEGVASLAGGILHFLGDAAFSQRETINFFNATGRTGQWAAINLPTIAAGYSARVNYTATGAQLVIEQAAQQSSLRGMSVAPPEQLLVLTPMGYKGGGEVRSLFGLGDAAGAETLVQAVNAHDPTAYSLMPATSLLAAIGRQHGAERQAGAWREALREHQLVLTSELSQRRERLDAGSWSAAATQADGFLASALWRNGDLVVAGSLAGERARSHPAGGGAFAIDRVSPGLALRFARDRTFVTLGTTVALERYDLSRPIEFPGTRLLARGTPQATRLDASLAAGHSFGRRSWMLTPSVGVLLSRWALEDFTEQGVAAGAAALTGWQSRALLAQAGLELKARLLEGRLVPRLQLNWLGVLGSSRSLGVRYQGASEGFTLPGIAPDQRLWQMALACDWRMNDRCAASVSLGGARGPQSQVTSEFAAGLRYAF
jgi:autotransporter-associated beta strand protein